MMKGEVEGFVVRQDGEDAGLQHVTEVSHGLVYCQELPVISAVFLLCRVELPGKKATGYQAFCWRTAPMAVVEASVTRASEAVWCA
jgi:hypothetical protein